MIDAPLLIDDSQPGVRLLTLNRPHRLNAFDGAALQALHDAVIEVGAAPGPVKVLLIRGAGRAFCAGNDLKWLASGVLANTAAHLRHQDLMQRTFESLERAPQVVVAAVHGAAVAGGFELAIACDILLVAEDAKIGDAHLARNLFPSGGSSQRLPRRIGLPRAMYYLLSGRTMDGREAERIGLAAQCWSAAELQEQAVALATEIARTDAHALASMKQCARRALEIPLTEGLALERWTQFRYRQESPALQASVQAFAAPRTAVPGDERS